MNQIEKLQVLQEELAHHPIYDTFSEMKNIRHFMRYHVFAVWDFMSLLKRLQRDITCVNLPWKPSPYPAEMVRLINQIVLGEESDVDQHGHPVSHFELYLRGMEEVGAPTSEIRDFLEHQNMAAVPGCARNFVEGNVSLALEGDLVEVASSFFFGREKLIPRMFESIVSTLKKEGVEAPTFLYYLERHIEVDGGEHGPLALKCLDHLTAHDTMQRGRAMDAGIKALQARKELWDGVLKEMP